MTFLATKLTNLAKKQNICITVFCCYPQCAFYSCAIIIIYYNYTRKFSLISKETFGQITAKQQNIKGSVYFTKNSGYQSLKNRSCVTVFGSCSVTLTVGEPLGDVSGFTNHNFWTSVTGISGEIDAFNIIIELASLAYPRSSGEETNCWKRGGHNFHIFLSVFLWGKQEIWSWLRNKKSSRGVQGHACQKKIWTFTCCNVFLGGWCLT